MFGLSIFMVFGLFFSGLLIGSISAAVGIGGGILTVPILVLFYHLQGEVATATSLGLIVFTSLSATYAYIREKRIDFRLAFVFIIIAVPGSVCGAILSQWLKAQNFELDIFQLLFAIIMIIIAFLKIITLSKSKKNEQEAKDKTSLAVDSEKWWQRRICRDFTDRRGICFRYDVKLFPGVIIAFLGGFIGSLLGLGGGVIYVPVLTMAMCVPAGIATATSTLTIFVATLFAVPFRYSSIQWEYVLFLALGTVISANIIPRLVHKVESEKLLTFFWIILILASLRMVLKVCGWVL